MVDREDPLKKQIQGVLSGSWEGSGSGSQWAMGPMPENYRASSSRRGSFNARIAIGLLAIQASLLLILSAKSNSSGAYGSETWRSIFPVSIPFLIWIVASSMKGSAAHHHHIEKLFPISIYSFVIGSILIVYFYFGRDGSFFLPSYYLFIISASTNLLSISEYLDGVVFDWSGVLEILIDGSKETNKDGVRIVALAPVIERKKLDQGRGEEEGYIQVYRDLPSEDKWDKNEKVKKTKDMEYNPFDPYDVKAQADELIKKAQSLGVLKTDIDIRQKGVLYSQANLDPRGGALLRSWQEGDEPVKNLFEHIDSLARKRDKKVLSLTFRGTNRINRSEIVVPNKNERLEEKKTNLVGYIVKRHTTGKWNPATVDVLYDHSRAEGYDGFSMGASTKIEENSLFYLLLISISNAEKKWTYCKPLSLYSGEGCPPIEVDCFREQLTVNHRWTKEELSRTALMIMRSISRIGPKIIEKKEPDRERKMLDINQDGKVDWRDLRAAIDVNKDGEVDIRDLTAIPGVLLRSLDTNQDGVIDGSDVVDLIARLFGMRTSKDLALDQSRRYLAEMAIRESTVGCTTINMHLMLGFLSCLSSLEVLERHQLSSIAWREMCNVYPIMARAIVERVKEDPGRYGDDALESMPKNVPRERFFDLLEEIKLAANDPTVRFTISYDDVLNQANSLPSGKPATNFLIRSLENVAGEMVDKVDQEPLGINPSDLLEKRKGVVLGSAIIMDSLREYASCFSKSGRGK